jgi:photosynthetic reaction center cytochrome c subunit
MESVQLGYRGLEQQLIVNPRILQKKLAETVVPAPQPPAAPVPIKAITQYPELKVLGDLSITEFNRQMAAISEWVAPPDQNCAYCHNLENMASYEKYTKTVALSMLKMTRDTNASWTAHVANTGVTCYTCHRGKPVPDYAWTSDPGPNHSPRFGATGQNTVSATVGFASLPYDPLTTFLDKTDVPIPVVSKTALPTDNPKTIKDAEHTYGLMMYINNSLGINCTYCHNSQAFSSWEQKKVTAWYAIRHVRAMNRDYIWPLADVLPDSRKGPLGDPKRIACETCHQGVYKPLFGAPMAKDYPGLMGTVAVAEAPAAPAPVAAEAPTAAPAAAAPVVAPPPPPPPASAPEAVVPAVAPVAPPAPPVAPPMPEPVAAPAPPAAPPMPLAPPPEAIPAPPVAPPPPMPAAQMPQAVPAPEPQQAPPAPVQQMPAMPRAPQQMEPPTMMMPPGFMPPYPPPPYPPGQGGVQ